jgi:predicted lipid-binding transport protein (Tim44 family)
VFSKIENAKRAVHLLREAGFHTEQITVVCSDETKEQHFREFEHQHPAGHAAPAAAAAGGSIGATVGGLAAGALGVAVGGPAFVVLGGAGLITGGLVGSFLGAMLTRGVDKEAADFYDQAVQKGKLLVVAEAQEPDAEQQLVQAEHAIATAGVEPLPLTEG